MTAHQALKFRKVLQAGQSFGQVGYKPALRNSRLTEIAVVVSKLFRFRFLSTKLNYNELTEIRKLIYKHNINTVQKFILQSYY